MKHEGDIQIIEAYLAGDKKALGELIKRYLKPLYWFAFGYVKNGADTEDIIQDVFVKIWKNLTKFDRTKNFKQWAFAIAKNTTFDHLKKKRTVSFSDLSSDGDNDLFEDRFLDTNPLPETIYEEAHNSEVLRNSIKKLSLKYQKVLELYNLSLTFREISAQLNKPLHTVKSQYRRALIILKKILPNSTKP